jgi:hypothetical protein
MNAVKSSLRVDLLLGNVQGSCNYAYQRMCSFVTWADSSTVKLILTCCRIPAVQDFLSDLILLLAAESESSFNIYTEALDSTKYILCLASVEFEAACMEIILVRSRWRCFSGTYRPFHDNYFYHLKRWNHCKNICRTHFLREVDFAEILVIFLSYDCSMSDSYGSEPIELDN